MPTSPVPAPPSRHARHSAPREEQTIKALDALRKDFDALVQVLSRYSPQRIVDVAGNVFQALAIFSGAGPAPDGSLHDLSLVDVSDGSTPKIQVTPGSIKGFVPTISADPINIKIGSPAEYPALTLDPSDTVVWLHIIIDSDGNIDDSGGMEVESGTTVPDSDATNFYLKISAINITFDGDGNAIVESLDDYLSGSQDYQFCAGNHLTGLV
jgi:hypothetical protein